MKILLKSVLLISIVTLFACSNKQKSKSPENQTNQVVEQSAQKFGIESSEMRFKMVNSEKLLTGGIGTFWILDGESEKELFMLYVVQAPIPEKLKEIIATEPKSLDAFFETALTSSAMDLGGADFSFSKIKYDKYDGMESLSIGRMLGEEDDGFIIKNRIFLIEENTFLILAAGEKSKVNIFDEFINSFVFKE